MSQRNLTTPNPAALDEIIREEIRDSGPMTVARFMELALYHPEHGYYSTAVEIGKRGDFYTSPHVHSLFGQILARQLEEMWESMGSPSRFQCIEMGAGHGYLARDILESPDAFNEAMVYSIIESSPRLRTQQQKLLGDRVCWHESLNAIEERSVIGCIFSNELIDSFPVHRFSRQNGRLQEMYVSVENGEFFETAGELSDPRIAAALEGIDLPDGIVSEVNLASLEWMTQAASALDEGYVLTIDYGVTEEDYYSPSRMSGTLRAFHQHQLQDNVFRQPGVQDITSHVNFTALARAGERDGLRTEGFTDQTRFLMGIGEQDIAETMTKFPGASLEDTRQRAAIRGLFHPQTMGGVFKVLIQSRGVEQVSLSGLKRARNIL